MPLVVTQVLEALSVKALLNLYTWGTQNHEKQRSPPKKLVFRYQKHGTLDAYSLKA